MIDMWRILHSNYIDSMETKKFMTANYLKFPPIRFYASAQLFLQLINQIWPIFGSN